MGCCNKWIYHVLDELKFLSYLLSSRVRRAARLWKKIIIMIILVSIEITIIQTIIFGFENMMYLFSMSVKFFFL